MSDWFKDWFASEDYLNVYAHRNNEDALRLNGLITKNLELKKDFKILDACCGAARHTKFFLEKGFDICGFDLSKTLLSRGKETLGIQNTPLICADVRKIPLKNNSFDLVLNLFTSFGYFNKDDENFSFFASVSEILKKNGYFVFDYLNANYISRNLIPKSEKVINGLRIEEKRFIKDKRVNKEIILTKNNQTKSFYESVALYGIEEIENQLEKNNLKIIKIFGNYDGEKFEKESSGRLILFCRKS